MDSEDLHSTSPGERLPRPQLRGGQETMTALLLLCLLVVLLRPLKRSYDLGVSKVEPHTVSPMTD